jgi:hypothetical protein
MLVAKIKDEIALWSLAGAKELSNIMACKTLRTTFFLINENSKSFVLFQKKLKLGSSHTEDQSIKQLAEMIRETKTNE